MGWSKTKLVKNDSYNKWNDKKTKILKDKLKLDDSFTASSIHKLSWYNIMD